MKIVARRALILAGGAGKRMQAGGDPALTVDQAVAARKGEKAFMPVGGRTFLDHQIDVLARAGIIDVCVVVGRDRNISGPFAQAIQAHPRGTADAVLAARGWARDEPFLVLNGDNLYPAAAIDGVANASGLALAGFDRADLAASGNIPAERINAFALLARDAAGHLVRIIEKPTVDEIRTMPAPVLVSMNLWKFDARIFDACRKVAPSSRGELELPAAVMLARSHGVEFTVVPACGPVLDLSRQSDIAEVARRLGAAT